ncbi:PQQ-dependent dehydrogenase, methanol/ethanol family [Rhodopila globiformis]|uniref:PQQ-dependent dehydrogenase, methanol/ethanol family n=1 Tax=Rhodopila globiformis TaxID=1071 RepID=A0A2S6NMD9_RHOGL|nr:PQQ-dependent dehydrogenase, methanol/ethanol family [Rhodopila globiformis]PPQ37193.1 PQQ-dependent dehydrogenase, methanol/ethanol family [Rhodopila globiformis]
MRRKRQSWVGSASGLALALGLITAAPAVADEALNQALQNPNNWPSYGRTQANTRFSPLKQINDQNVGQLKLAYAFQLGALRSNEATPIVIGDTLYVSSSSGPRSVYALDAKTGKIRWQYQPVIAEDVDPFVCCDLDSRGVAYADSKILFGTLDAHLIALDAKTGKPVWNTVVVDYKGGMAITSPPTIVKNLAVIGYAGGEYGARGALQAYDLKTGKQVWKTYTIPGPGEPGNDTWKGDSWKHGGGAAWQVGSYDPQTNTVFYGTSNPGPWNAAVRSTGTSDYGQLTNLYTSSTLALDGDTGKIKWALQSTPAEAWDYDGVNELVLADITIDGKKTPVMMKADRDGFFFVANRDTGKLISAKPFVPVNWAKSYDIAKARPIEDPAKRPHMDAKTTDICPSWMGGKNWQPMSFNPETGLVYVTTNNMCQDMQTAEVTYRRGSFYLGNDFSVNPGHGDHLGQLLALDPATQKPAWTMNLPLPWNGGTMTTAGNLVFFGDINGIFHALDAKTGKPLWQMNVGSGMGAGPMTFSVDGKQYVAILTGRAESPPAFMGEVGKKIMAATPEGGTLFVFTL